MRRQVWTILLAAGVGIAATPAPPLPSDSKLPPGTEAAPARDPARAVLYMGRGNDLVKQGQWEEAVEQFRRAAAYDPLNAAAPVNLAFVLDRLRRYDEAFTALQSARLLTPNDPTVYLNWGNTLINMGKFQDALEPLTRATELAPSNHQAHVNLAVSYGRLGKNEEANNEMTRAVQLLFAQALELGKQDRKSEAIASYRQITQLAPQFLPAYINAAILLEQTGKLDESITTIEAALKVAPQEAPLLEMLQRLRQARAGASPATAQ